MSESDDSDIDPFIPDENPEDFEVPAFEEFGITGDESGSDDSVIPNNSDADLLDRIEALEARLNNFPLPQPLFPVFVVQAGTGNTWAEVVPVNGTLTAGGPRSFTGDTVSGAAIITLAANQSAVVESKDPGTTNSYTRFIAIGGSGGGGSSNGTTVVAWLTKTGGTDGDGTTPASWIYSVYTESTKTTAVLTSAAPLAARVTAASNTPAAIGLYDYTVNSLVHAFESYAVDYCIA